METKVSIILPYYNRKDLIINTLKSFEYFYHNKNIEVIIVDDCSADEHRLDGFLNFNLNIKLIRLENKNGVNPCYPYNVGVKESSGDILILTSPETFHTTNMFDISDNFNGLDDDTCLLFSVFCLTDKTLINNILNEPIFNLKLSLTNFAVPNFYLNLGEFGYSYNNRYGSWYLHSIIKRSDLNFFMAITRNKFYDLSGFDERFRFGTGYDDDDFKDRLIETNSKFIYLDNAVAIHIDHAIVNNLPPTTNYNVYNQSKINKYLKNDLWGVR